MWVRHLYSFSSLVLFLCFQIYFFFPCFKFYFYCTSSQAQFKSLEGNLKQKGNAKKKKTFNTAEKKTKKSFFVDIVDI